MGQLEKARKKTLRNLQRKRTEFDFTTRKVALRAATGGRASTILTDNLAFFPELGVLFNRIKKSGNTSIFLFFHELATGAEVPSDEIEAVKRQRSIRDVDYRTIGSAGKSKTFTCVRNPYTRALSGFLEKIGAGGREKFSAYPGFGDTSPQALEAFLEFIAEADWTSVDRHFWPQERLLFQPAKHFDCIAKLETLSADMAGFLEGIGLDPATAASLSRPHPQESALQGKITNSSRRDDLLTPRVRDLIERAYAADFDTFDYG